MYFMMRRILYSAYTRIVCLIFSAIVAQTSFAVSDVFTTRTLIGGDTMPPTVPASLVALPITQSQIDLSWAPATDDWALAGYRIWRDHINIATTTLTTYSDTGLASSTTYTYYITAFDTSFNESASSTSVATTTLSPAPVVDDEDDEGPRYGSRATPFDEMVTSLQVFPQKDSVLLRYETKKHVRAVVKWGTGISYELGSLVERSLGLIHETRIVGLSPGTQYSFTIEGEDALERYGTLHTGTFTTLLPDDTFPPGNVTGLNAEIVNQDILLSWINPEDSDFTKVRVLRSDRFYPSDTADGWVVYEGTNNSIQDRGAVVGERQFYTVFTYDDKGNVSSGAVIRVQTGTTSIAIVNPALNPIKLSFDDVGVFQGGVQVPRDGVVTYIDGTQQFTISIPYEKLPEHLKTILVRVEDSQDSHRTFEFLLRVDAGRTVYTGTIAPLGIAGEFPVVISVFDFETTQVGYTEGVISSHIRPIHTDSDGADSGFFAYLSKLGASYLVWLLLLILILLLVSRRLTRVSE